MTMSWDIKQIFKYFLLKKIHATISKVKNGAKVVKNGARMVKTCFFFGRYSRPPLNRT